MTSGEISDEGNKGGSVVGMAVDSIMGCLGLGMSGMSPGNIVVVEVVERRELVILGELWLGGGRRGRTVNE